MRAFAYCFLIGEVFGRKSGAKGKFSYSNNFECLKLDKKGETKRFALKFLEFRGF